jgi:hypothetical protein
MILLRERGSFNYGVPFFYYLNYVVYDIIYLGDEMPNINRKYINKPFMLNLDDSEEKELYEWLKKLPAREFKQQTKKYWIKKMKEGYRG